MHSFTMPCLAPGRADINIVINYPAWKCASDWFIPHPFRCQGMSDFFVLLKCHIFTCKSIAVTKGKDPATTMANRAQAT